MRWATASAVSCTPGAIPSFGKVMSRPIMSNSSQTPLSSIFRWYATSFPDGSECARETLFGETPISPNTMSSTSSPRRSQPGMWIFIATWGLLICASEAARKLLCSASVNVGETPISPIIPARISVSPIPWFNSLSIVAASSSTVLWILWLSNFSR